MHDQEIDTAAAAGFKSFSTGAKMPAWIQRDEILVDAWNIGRRLAANSTRLA